MNDMLPPTENEPGWIISAGGAARFYFHGSGYTIYRNRAKVYGNKADAEYALKIVANGYHRPKIRVEEVKGNGHE